MSTVELLAPLREEEENQRLKSRSAGDLLIGANTRAITFLEERALEGPPLDASICGSSGICCSCVIFWLSNAILDHSCFW